MIRPSYRGDAYSYLSELITHQMYPFRPGEVIVRTYFDSEMHMAVQIEISALPNDPYLLKDQRVFQSMDVGHVACEIGMRASKYFKSLPVPPVGDNVILGSN